MLHLESRSTTLVNGGHSEERLGNLTMENGACPFLVSVAKCKKRKISAVRDFPPGCGRFAQQICLRPRKDTICADAVGDTICKDESSDRLKNETSDSSKGLHRGDIATQKEGMVPFLFLLNGSNSNGMDKSAAKKYLPSRKVSAVRQFPQFCGRNTYQLSKEMSLGVVASSEDNILVQNKLGPEMDDKPSSQAAKTDVDKMVDDVQDGDSHKSKLEENDSEVAREEVQPRVFPEVLPSLQKTTIGQENSGSRMDGKQPTVEVITDLKQTVDGVQDVDFHKSDLEGNSSKVIWDEVQPKHEVHVGEEMNEQDDTVISSEAEKEHEGVSCIDPSLEDKLVWWDHEFDTVVGKEDDDIGDLEENLGMEIVVYSKNKTNENLSDTSGCQIQSQAEKLQNLELSSNRVVVQGLMAGSNCPWSQGKDTSKSKPAACVSGNKRKKLDSMTQVERHRDAARTKVDGKDSKEKSLKKISPYGARQGTDELVIWDKIDSSSQVERHSDAARTKVDGKVSKEKSLKKIPPDAAHQGTAELVIWDKKKSLEHSGHEDPNVAPSSSDLGVFLPPFRLGTSSKKGHGNDATGNRNKVRETLRLFQAVCRKLLQEEEGKSKGGGKFNRRVDTVAAKILKEKNKYVNTGKQILGAVPGVEVGDEFQYRVELIMIGLHRQVQAGIDYVKQGKKILATSIVASGAYADDLDNSDVLIYTGQGGNVMYSEKAPEDQKLVRGNLSLKNSLDEQTPVRVIRGCESSDGKSKTYVYDGFYLVKKFWQEPGPHGKLVFKFHLDRIPGQPELAWKQVKSKKFKVREGLCVADISQGKEPMPICAVNTIDDEKPPPFTYITSVIYPDWLSLSLPGGCDCIIGCSDSGKCACAVKNGGEIPFNHNGAIVEAKPLVYECGPQCRCPPTCHNRVSQKGTKFQLEIFKTESRGWGVRSLNFIPSGSFVCEYIGELLKEKEAEERAGNDEYLFDIGNNYNDSSLWDGLATLIPDTHLAPCEVVEDGGLTIDAARCGNIGRFINHSCTPNLYAQNVLFDHDDRRIPHIMLFSAENIPPLQELTYHYNYTIDQVRDSDGNIRKKECFCGSHECTGRLY